MENDTGDGHVFEQLVAAGEDVPVEDTPCRSPVPVGERVDVSQEEMQDDPRDDGMDEIPSGTFILQPVLVRESAQLIDETPDLMVLRRLVVHKAGHRISDHHIIALPEPPDLLLIHRP